MIQFNEYRKFFFLALFLHGLLVVLLLWDNTNERPAMTLEAKNEPGIQQNMSQQIPQQPQAIQAVSVDSHQVMDAMKQLKEERAQTARAEANRQRALAMQAEAAKRQRVAEQQRLERIKNEAAKLALAQKKQMEEERQRLEQLAKQKEAEKQQLQALQEQQRVLQKQQQAEQQKLAALRTKQEAEEKERQTKAREADVLAKQQADALAKQQAEAAALAKQQAAQENAAKQARIAGAVDKYKALIIHAIGQQWILPDRVDSRLSSQFRIRLAPNGTVLEVNLIRSSGDPVLDRSAQAAIYKASPLPVPSDSETFNLFRDISLTVRPENIQG
jgi:colicin import membrane protein